MDHLRNGLTFILLGVMWLAAGGLVSCALFRSTPQVPPLEEARERFHQAVTEARQRPCVPDDVQRAYADLRDAVERADSAETWDEFVSVDEQQIDRFNEGVCTP